MDPRLVNGLVALTGVAAAVAAAYVDDVDSRIALVGYACAVFGYCKRRFGDLEPAK